LVKIQRFGDIAYPQYQDWHRPWE